VISLPLVDTMTHDEVDQVVESLHVLIGGGQGRRRPKLARNEQHAPLVYERITRATGEIALE
jgi:hypothetical protein